MVKHVIVILLLCTALNAVTIARVHVKSATLKQALIFRINREPVRGKLVEIGEDFALVLSAEGEVKVPFAEMSRVLLTFEHGSRMGPFYGAVLGGYSSAIIYTASRDRGGFVESQDLPWYALVVVPSIALGAGIGYLVDPGSGEKEEVYDFTGDDDAKTREKSKLIGRLTHESPESNVHITLEGSHIYSNMQKFTVPGASSYNDYILSEFRLLRRAQATYSFMPEVEAGVALVWFGEPPQSIYGYEYFSNGDSKSYNVSQTFDGTGKYIVAAYRPLYHLLDSRIDVKVGGGIGTASVDYARGTSIVTNTLGVSSTQDNSVFHVSENAVAAYMFGQIEFQPSDGLSIGLSADKVFGPSKDAPAVPKASIPAQTLHLDNAGLGFTISLHF